VAVGESSLMMEEVVARQTLKTWTAAVVEDRAMSYYNEMGLAYVMVQVAVGKIPVEVDTARRFHLVGSLNGPCTLHIRSKAFRRVRSQALRLALGRHTDHSQDSEGNIGDEDVHDARSKA